MSQKHNKCPLFHHFIWGSSEPMLENINNLERSEVVDFHFKANSSLLWKDTEDWMR